ncbi:MAG: hypothetical protein AAF512_05325 [Pseudomonadota bacterium]
MAPNTIKKEDHKHRENNMLDSFVIAISGPSGCGKTSLVKSVAAMLDDAAMLFFDDWADDPPGIETWIAEPDADYGRWQTPELAEALSTLRHGKSITVPELSPSVGTDRSNIVTPAPFIVIEEPYGRLRRDTANLLDLVVCIDIPLHIALARRLLRHTRTLSEMANAAPDEKNAFKHLHWSHEFFEEFLEFYIDKGHLAYANQLRRLKESSDLVVEGVQSIDILTHDIVEAIQLAYANRSD